jgi:hypothetical protein
MAAVPRAMLEWQPHILQPLLSHVSVLSVLYKDAVNC